MFSISCSFSSTPVEKISFNISSIVFIFKVLWLIFLLFSKGSKFFYKHSCYELFLELDVHLLKHSFHSFFLISKINLITEKSFQLYMLAVLFFFSQLLVENFIVQESYFLIDNFTFLKIIKKFIYNIFIVVYIKNFETI